MENSKSQKLAKSLANKTASATLLLFCGVEAQASTSNLPWYAPIEELAAVLSGPTAILFVICGLIVIGIRLVFPDEMVGIKTSWAVSVLGFALLVIIANFLMSLLGA